MVQRTIVVNQFTAAYLIEFTAEPRMVQPALIGISRILVLLLVSFITIMLHVDYHISLTHLCFICSMFIVSIDVLIYLAAQLQECLTNLLTYFDCWLFCVGSVLGCVCSDGICT